MRFVNLFGVFGALAFALCLFACDDTVSSTDTSETNGLDAIPGFNIKPYSSGNGETSSSGGSSSSFEESSASEESSSSVEEESSSSEESNSVSSEESSSSKRSSSSSEENSSSGESSSSLEDSSSSEESSSSEDSSSSSSEELSSSSISVQNPGTCGPEQPVVEKFEKVTWVFTNNASEFSGAMLLKSTFTWTTSGGNPASATVSNYNGKTHQVEYATSGKHNATLHIDVTGGSSYDLTCSSVHVNGDPITGCKCSTSAASVDYTSTPDVTWSVTGCTTASDLSTYNWDGVDGGTTFTKSFYAPTASYAPVLKVGNTDNTVVDVACPAVTVTEGPEYKIVATGNAGAIRLPAGSTTVTLKVDAPNSTVFCNVDRSDSPSGALNGFVNNVAINGSDYISASMPARTLVNGATLEFYLDVPATCGVQ